MCVCDGICAMSQVKQPDDDDDYTVVRMKCRSSFIHCNLFSEVIVSWSVISYLFL